MIPINLCLFGGRGSSSSRSGGSGAAGGDAGVTDAQNRAVEKIADKTRNLKKEQYRIINENGEVVLQSKGDVHSVTHTVGESRDFLPGAVSIHNHPGAGSGIGGTFSEVDLRDFGYGARQIVAAAPEGTYKLTNVNYNTKKRYDGWHEMQQKLIQESEQWANRSTLDVLKEARSRPHIARMIKAMSKISDQWVKAKEAGKPQAVLDKYAAEYNSRSEKYKDALKKEERKIGVEPFHEFYKKNAAKYGFKYEFIRKK